MIGLRRFRLVLLLCSASIAFLIAAAGAVKAQSSPGRVGLVIQFLDGRIEEKCIEINKDPFKGYDVLTASGYSIIFDFSSSNGAAICKIQQDGCSAENCFCDMPNYWSYWHLGKDGQGQDTWIYSNLGSSNRTVQAGDVEGWHYGEGAPPSEKPTFEEICPPSEPTSTSEAALLSPTRTTAPTVFIPPPTNPPVWSTAIIIDPPTSTNLPPTNTPTSTPTLAPTVFQPTATPVAEEPVYTATPTQAAEGDLALPTLTMEPPTPTRLESAVPPTQPAPAKNTEPKKRPKATSSSVTTLQKSGATATRQVAQAPGPAEAKDPGASGPQGAWKWVLILGASAGLGSFLGFFVLLTGGLIAIYFLRRK